MKSYFFLSFRRRAVRKLIVLQRRWFHLNAVTRMDRRQVTPISYHHGKHKVFVEAIDEFRDPILKRGADRDVVKKREMLNILTQTYATSMRANRHAGLGCH